MSVTMEPAIATTLPRDVIDVFQHFYTAELTTVGKSGAPITWPIMPIFWARRGTFVTLTSIGLPQKAFNIIRNPQVSLLYSDSTGSDLNRPPSVLVQGTAEVADKMIISRRDADPELFEVIMDQAGKMIRRQPAMAMYMKNPLTRYLMDWYFMRLLITIQPHRITWWPEADFSRRPGTMEVSHVDAHHPLPA
jgi:hypothetical protein